MEYNNTDQMMEAVVKAYQQGFNDRQMGRPKQEPADFGYLMGWRDGQPRSGPMPE